VGFLEESDANSRYLLNKGDVLLSHINSLEMAGNCALYNEDKKLFHGMNLLRLQPKKSVIHVKYHYYIVKTHYYKNKIQASSKHAINQVSLSISSLKDIKVCLPPLSEQEAIVEYLDSTTIQIDNLIAMISNQVELYKASNYREMNFEEHIESHLLNSGYRKRTPEEYDKALCLIPDEVIQFIQATQPKEFEKLEKQYGADTSPKLLERIAREVGKYGVLYVLRKGVADRGAKFKLAYFKPSSGMNPEHQTLYQGNRFSVVRQLKYSQKNENSIDTALFLNGLPIVTIELKNSLTGQTLENAEKQYKHDRLPNGEPLLAFKRCLVHFAVGNEQASMTTHLQGEKTRFFPFNKDSENPVNPNGHKTHYLWEDIWQASTLLELINNYLHVQAISERSYDPTTGSVTEKVSEAFIFPRYHQLDVVRHLLKLVQADGVGKNYLVQHSAGSGKSNSIAWLAHQLASFYQKADDTERLFDSIIVVTDRRLLDRQLQNTIKQFEQTEGVVKKIDENSAQLRDALEAGKAIIITTLQKFPVISASMTDLKGKRFAVIIDEAHSSQSGESAKHLKKTLAVNLEQAEAEDQTGDDLEDEIIQRDSRARSAKSHLIFCIHRHAQEQNP
jgi:type I restriction enzyme, R subunit